jgi:ABC-type polysaccharide/polyol phosphate export permease
MILKWLRLLNYLALSELSRRYAGTVGGALWAVASPAALIGVMWVALDFGLQMRVVVGSEYGVTLAVGMLCWLFLADVMGDAPQTVVRAPHLVKKTLFSVELLPLAGVLSALMVHAVLVILAALVLLALGKLSLATLWTLPLWMSLVVLLSVGLSLLTSALNVIVRDTGSTTPFLMSLWFWLTPIVWPLSQLPVEWRGVALANPMAVAIDGYRYALLGAPLTFGVGSAALAFAVGFCLVALGALVFSHLRQSFADSL